MLQLKNITKKYITGDTSVLALDDVNLEFDKCEFVSILGPSGCGKTTMLNIIGGLDRYTSGDLIINGKSTKDFIDSDWDAYRNNSVGFVFQNYNLIPHLNVLENVELALTLSGFPDVYRKAKATEALKKVGLSDQLKKRPNQLSGGQMQRVAIARALVNDPDIILADEPTGALDSVTSVQIMDLLREIAKERLIIMVTHNSEIADKYSTRIIRLLDGKVINDDKSQGECIETEKRVFVSRRSSMSYLTSLKLSFKNLVTKRARALITSFAGSIGIIGIALVLAISTGFSAQINALESDTLAAFPITIDDGQTYAMPRGADFRTMFEDVPVDIEAFPETEDVILYDHKVNVNLHVNKLNESYLEYLNAMNPKWYNSISYNRSINMNIVNKVGDNYVKLNTGQAGWQEIIANYEFLNTQYDVLKGKLPETRNQIVLIVDKYNRLTQNIVNAVGLETEDIANYTFDDFIGMQFKLINNDLYYQLDEDSGLFKVTSTFNEMYNNPLAETIEIVGILRVKQGASSSIMWQGLAYSRELTDYVMQSSKDSAIAISQKERSDINVITGNRITSAQYKSLMQSLGVDTIPKSINIYPSNIANKELIKDYLDSYNQEKAKTNQILYLDISDIITGTMGTIIDGITYILIAFAAISLVVSSIMIGIITYISVLERTKEIGVLRSLGARKKDISRVFNAETLIIGFTSGLMGVLLAALLTIPINIIVANLAEEFTRIATLRFTHAVLLVIISMSLTLIAGLIPSRMAANKDPVVALRTE